MIRQPSSVIMNTRFLDQELTGVQRYGREMLTRLSGSLQTVQPQKKLPGLQGHLWEQFQLPHYCRGQLLWSPGNTGPLGVRDQIVTLHDAATLDHPEWFTKKFALWYRFLLPRLARRVRKIITISEFSRQRLLETCALSASQLEVVYPGVDPRFHPVPEHDIRSFRQKYRLQRPYFLYLGSLEPRKNIGPLLQAWPRLGWKEGELILAGASGPIFQSRGFGSLPPRVRLWGRVREEDLPSLFSAATGFVFPSLYEGFGLPPLEAMACGCPVLAAGTTSLPEVCGAAFNPVTRTGQIFYFDPRRSDELVFVMRRLLDLNAQDRDHLRRQGLARAAEFTWERSASQTWKILQQELSR